MINCLWKCKAWQTKNSNWQSRHVLFAFQPQISQLLGSRSGKTMIGPKNPALCPLAWQRKNHIFFTGFYGLITGCVRVNYGFLKTGFCFSKKIYGFSWVFVRVFTAFYGFSRSGPNFCPPKIKNNIKQVQLMLEPLWSCTGCTCWLKNPDWFGFR